MRKMVGPIMFLDLQFRPPSIGTPGIFFFCIDGITIKRRQSINLSTLLALLLAFSFTIPSQILAQPIRAKYNRNAADSVAITMDQNSVLFQVSSNNVSDDGTSALWKYGYMGGINNDRQYYFHVNADSVVYDSVHIGPWFGATWISRDWIDSDSALSLAASQGGKQFINANPHYQVQATLYEAVVPNHQPLWNVTYISLDDASQILRLGMNATITGVLEDNRPPIACDFVLLHNYPNPFNPSTSISFDVPRQAHVRVTVYNLVGQEVAVLVDGVLPQGQHSVRWQPENASSGIYFVRLQAGEFRATRKTVLLR